MDELTKDTPKTEEQVWARHILVDTEAEAKSILNFLKAGGDFATFAKTSSKDTGSGANGGDLGWFGKGQMIPEFEAAAFKMKVGEISEPIKTQYGYHIIQVLGHENRPLTATQYEQAKQKVFEDWLTAARAATKVTTFDIWKDPRSQQNQPLHPLNKFNKVNQKNVRENSRTFLYSLCLLTSVLCSLQHVICNLIEPQADHLTR